MNYEPAVLDGNHNFHNWPSFSYKGRVYCVASYYHARWPLIVYVCENDRPSWAAWPPDLSRIARTDGVHDITEQIALACKLYFTLGQGLELPEYLNKVFIDEI